MTSPPPSLFVSHGAPTLAVEATPAHRFLRGLGAALPRPRAILAVSAHWETAAPAVSGAAEPETIHDFFGFPAPLYRLRYPAPGAPELAERVRGLLAEAGIEARVDPGRGLDHGAWVPLMLVYPEADIPTLQLSVQPGRGAEAHLELGGALAPLRDEGVLIMGSGAATHNLGAFRTSAGHGPPLDEVAAFSDWLHDALCEGRRDELLAYRTIAPHGAWNHPSAEHFLPLFVALGAAGEGAPAAPLHRSYEYRAIAMDAYRFG